MNDRVPVKGNFVDSGPQYYSFFLKKEWMTECQWKETVLTVGPSLVAEALSWLVIAS